MRRMIVGFVGVVLLLAAGIAQAEIICYGVTWGGSLYTVDVSTGASTLVGPTGYSNLNSLAATSTGRLYTVRNRTPAWGTDTLMEIDPETGAGTLGPVIDLGLDESIPTIAISSDDTIYVTQGYLRNGLYTVDASTGVGTLVGYLAATDIYGIQGTDFSPSGTLYGWDLGKSGNPGPLTAAGLVTIDTNTGLATDVNPAVGGSGEQTLAFAPDGTLYLASGSLYTVNPATGVKTLVGSTGGFRGLAFVDTAAVPEPASLAALLGMGIMGLVGYRWRKGRSS